MPDMTGGQGDAVPGWADLCPCERVSGGNWRTLICSIYKYIYYTKNNIWNRYASKKGEGLKK